MGGKNILSAFFITTVISLFASVVYILYPFLEVFTSSEGSGTGSIKYPPGSLMGAIFLGALLVFVISLVFLQIRAKRLINL